jgi:hypothetical protein
MANPPPPLRAVETDPPMSLEQRELLNTFRLANRDYLKILKEK